MTKHTKLIDPKEYIKWYNLAKTTVNDKSLIPDRTDEQIGGLVSDNNWLIFSTDINVDKKEAREKPEPNVWFELLSENGTLTGFASIGLSFDKIELVRKFVLILHNINKETKDILNEKLKSGLKYDWELSVNRKIKSRRYDETPTYTSVKKWDIKDFGGNIVDKAVETAKQIENEGKINKEKILNERRLANNKSKYYCELPTINLIETINFNLDEYEGRISEIFSVLKLVLLAKGKSEIKQQDKEDRDNKEILEILEDKINRANNELIFPSQEEYDSWLKRRDELIEKLKR